MRIEPRGAKRGDVYYLAHIPPASTWGHVATASVRNVKTGEIKKVTRQFSI
jgi:hypothetical protein